MTERRDVRQVSDSRVLAAVAHPLRRRLLAVLSVDGPLTVGMLADRTDQAVGNVSHHLRRLAEVDLIVEAPELARDRRERWWRRTSSSLQWATGDFDGDPAGEVIVRAAESINLAYQASVIGRWAEADPETTQSWPNGPFASDCWMHLTDDELAELGAEMIALMNRWADRGSDTARPAEPVEPSDPSQLRRPVYVFARGVPGRP